MEELLKNIYIDQVELKVKDPPYLNICIVKGKDRSLLIDAGVGENLSPEYRDRVVTDLRELKIDWKDLDCLITHSHLDHIGLVPFLRKKGVRIFMNPDEIPYASELIYYRAARESWRKELFESVGLSERKTPEAYDILWGYAERLCGQYDGVWEFPFEEIHPGDTLDYGGYDWKVVPLKGHTFGQVGLWDEKQKVIFCADHVMKNIAPIVSCTGGYRPYLEDYLNTMKQVKHTYAGCLFIPGHGPAFRDADQEADRIIYSYLSKCSLMYDTLRKAAEPMCIRDIGVVTYGREGHLPDYEKFHSCLLIWGKTYACLEYMKGRGLVKSEPDDGAEMWSACNR